jgi:hypothetical protein
MTRRVLPRLLAAAASIAALAAALTVVAGTGSAQTSAAQANYAPTNTAAPTISGTPQTGQTLTANQGTWTSDTTPTFAYQWLACDAQGNNCASISGATSQTYAVQSANEGKTIRVTVTASNTSGSSTATSAQTAAVTKPGSTPPATSTGGTIAASSVVLPNRLIINRVKFSPGRLTSRAPFTGRFHVADSSGRSVNGALVFVTPLPYSWGHTTSGEVRTDETGWATLTITPTRNLPLFGRAALVMFVRARVEGQPLLSGSSVRRLVQVTVR